MTVRSNPEIIRLAYGSMIIPPDYPADAPYRVFGYLIRHPEGLVLVDTGMGMGNEFIEKAYSPSPISVERALGEVCIKPSEIDLIVLSHLHFDHCGGVQLFPDTPLLAQSDEITAAKAPLYTVPEWAFPAGITYQPVDGDYELLPGVMILSTPGHTPGHQSVQVDINGKTHLIAAQAMLTGSEWTNGGDPSQAHPEMEDTYLSTAKNLRGKCPDAVYFSHDPVTWRPAPPR